jgi:hypothetical protein
MYDILSLTNSNLITADDSFMYEKKLYLIHDFHPLFHCHHGMAHPQVADGGDAL